MTTAFDTKLIPKVLEIVNRLGKSVSITAYSGTVSYNPATGESTPGTATSYSLKVTPPESYRESYIDGEMVKAGDAKVWLPASGLLFTPTIGIFVTMDSVKWRVMNVEPIYTGDNVALYGLQIRKT